MVLVLELERRRWVELIAQNTWCSIIPNGRVSFLGLYQRKIIVMLCSLCMRQKCTAKYNHSTVSKFACAKTASGGIA